MPTQDRYPTEGVYPLGHTTDKVGLMSDNINEIIMVDWSLMHPNSDKNEMEQFYDSIDITNIKIGIPKIHFQDGMHPNTKKSFDGVLDLIINNKYDTKTYKITLMDDNDEYFDNDLMNKDLPLDSILDYEYPREVSFYLNMYDESITLRELWSNSVGYERNFSLSLLNNNPVNVACIMN